VRRDRSSIPWHLVWLALFFLTLRPFEPVTRLVDVAVSPLRFVAELASPLVILKRNRVVASEERLAADAEAGVEENRQLLRDLYASALPTEPGLLAGRRVVHAEVLGRLDRDHVRVRLHDPRGVVPGLPVAFGNVFVGRVAVDASGRDRLVAGEPDVVLVQLVTAADFHVGARVAAPIGETEDVLMTVGGVLPRPGPGRGRPEIRLAVQNPSDRSLTDGLARVHELFRDEEEFAGLSEGLRLGSVQRDDDGFWVAPELDYMDGLFHLVVLCPPDETLGAPREFDAVLQDASWLRTRPLGIGDPSPARSTCKLRVGLRDGVARGAAVTSVGAHLVGRVVHARPWTSDVAFLDDPGFRVVAVARFDGEPEPRVLGRLVALGREPESGAFLFRWVVRVAPGITPREGETTRRARLYTGAGDDGLPAGFSFGEAEIPLDARPGDAPVIRVRTDVLSEDVHALYVRLRAGA
jgi:hypothetical protein